MRTMNGFRSARLRRNLTIRELSDLCGISTATIRHCEAGTLEAISLDRVAALASALDISIAEGCRVYEFAGPRQLPLRHPPRNILEAYMAFWDLTVQSLAFMLDVSPQTVSVQCGKKVPSLKYVKQLAEMEEVPVTEFIERYGEGMSCVVL